MALKGPREILETDITRTCSTVATRGVGLVKQTGGSGNTLGDFAGVAALVANPSGYKFAGLLINDVVNIDQTRYHRNFHKDETQVNERCNLLRKGWVVTDQITGTPTDGQTAYLTANGQFTPTVSATGGTAATPKAGEFGGAVDENGFGVVHFNLPV